MSPTSSSSGFTGATVHNCPDSILPLIELPRGRNCTVSPFFSRSIYGVAHPMPGYEPQAFVPYCGGDFFNMAVSVVEELLKPRKASVRSRRASSRASFSAIGSAANRRRCSRLLSNIFSRSKLILRYVTNATAAPLESHPRFVSRPQPQQKTQKPMPFCRNSLRRFVRAAFRLQEFDWGLYELSVAFLGVSARCSHEAAGGVLLGVVRRERFQPLTHTKNDPGR